MIGSLRSFLFEKERGEDTIENAGTTMLYVGILSLIFIFLGYVTKTILISLNITDPANLPIFGKVLAPLTNALKMGATVILILFLLFLVMALVGIVKWLKTETI